MKKISIAVASVAVLAIAGYAGYHYMPKWPKPVVTEANQKLGESLVKEFQESNLNPAARSQQYKPDGDYLNYSKTQFFANGGRVKLDTQGLPTIAYGDGYQYNPVTLSNYGLGQFGKNLPNKPGIQFWRSVDKLIAMQGFDGALRYGFTFQHYALKKAYPAGWASGMAQGLSLSMFSRAYLFSKDEKYREAGEKALAFLDAPVSLGGPKTSMAGLDPSLSNYIFFEEYIGDKGIYTVNGFMFTLLGLYDWCHNMDSKKACSIFDDGVKTLVKILPYYDFGGFSSYDLTHITYGRPVPHYALRYHSTHIYLLRALYSVTNEETLNKYAVRWNAGVDRSK